MPKTIFTQQEINNYSKIIVDMHKWPHDIDPNLPQAKQDSFQFFKWPAALHTFYRFTVWHTNEMRTHADGLFPTRLIADRRPNEPLEVFAYRSVVYEAKSKPTFDKTFTSLQKIRRSADWRIVFDPEKEKQFSAIGDEETLEKYTTENYPYFTSLTNWIFTVMLRKALIDPNAVVLVKPESYIVADNEYLKPFTTVFDSEDVIDYSEEDYCVLNNPVGCSFYSGRNNELTKGKSFYIVTTQDIYCYDQVDNKGNFLLIPEKSYNHQLGLLPAFKLRGILVEQAENQFMYESRIASMLPELNEAVREYSDLQAAKVLNIYPERWEYSNISCPHCKGFTYISNPEFAAGCNTCPETIPCPDCKGTGIVQNKGPFSKILLKPGNAAEGQGTIPTPPAGYIQKDVATVEYQDRSVKEHLYEALAAINYQFLAESPLKQSGVAKLYDKDESNNFTHSVAEDIICAMDNCMKVIALYRYGKQYAQDMIIDDMLPEIPVPENFDNIYLGLAEQELTAAKANKLNPVALSALEVDYVSKRFNSSPEVRDRLVLVLSLDPLPNITDDVKMTMLSNKGITQETYVITSNIQEFVQRALEEDEGFASLDLTKQKDKMKEYAQEQIAAQSAKAKIIPLMGNQGGVDSFGNPIQPNQPGPGGQQGAQQQAGQQQGAPPQPQPIQQNNLGAQAANNY